MPPMLYTSWMMYVLLSMIRIIAKAKLDQNTVIEQSNALYTL